MDKFKESWQPAEIFSHISTNSIRSSKNNKNFSTMQNIKFNSCVEKYQEPKVTELLSRKKIYIKTLKKLQKRTHKSKVNSKFSMKV